MEISSLSLTKGPRLVYCNFNTRDVESEVETGVVKKTAKGAVKKTKSSKSIECTYSLETFLDDDNKKVMVFLSIKSDSKNIPFYFDIKAQAEFKYEDVCPTEQLVVFESVPYIFIFLKELVADLTRKSYFSPFYLPPMGLTEENLKSE